MTVETDFEGVSAEEQLAALAERALDDRPVSRTGFPDLDKLFHRGGLHPGTLVVLGGRMHTRKTTFAMNWMWNLVVSGVPVGFVTLDESLPQYVAKMMSVQSQLPQEWLEENWATGKVEKLRARYLKEAALLTMTKGYRPNTQQLTQWLEMGTNDGGFIEQPRVVFVDYVSLLVHYRGKSETSRVQVLMEDLQVWTKENDIIVVALHQAGRMDEGVSKRYHGDTPMTAEALMHGGEQQADIVLATYRPALNQLGNMSMDQAEMILGDNFDEEKWQEAKARVRRYERSTFVQLLKNRPGTKLNFEGVELYSPNESQAMTQAGDSVGDDAQWKGHEDA